MTDTVDTTYRRGGVALPTVDPFGSGPPSDEAEALFKEARRRRRRRWTIAVVALVVALVATVVGLALSGGGTTKPPGKTATGGPLVGGRRVQDRTAAVGLVGFTPPAVELMGQADSQLVWAAGIKGLYLSGDSGATWHTVTPPNLANQYVAERVTTLSAVGENDLWLVLEDVPGLVPFAQSKDGSDRGEGIDRSTDGGPTWTFSPLPRVPPAVRGHFVELRRLPPRFCGRGRRSRDAARPAGDALHHAGRGCELERSATPLDLAGVVVGGPAPVPQLVFTQRTERLGGHRLVGGLRRLDGRPGRRRVPDDRRRHDVVGRRGLPSGSMTLPTFFGPNDGVVLRDPQPPSTVKPVVYATHDGGASDVVAGGPAGRRRHDLQGW